jgi:hypothetical protein
LEGLAKTRCDDANILLELTVNVAYALYGAGADFVIEHPEDLGRLADLHTPASIWRLPEITKLAADTMAQTTALFQCTLSGAEDCDAVASKPTRLLGTPTSLGTANYSGWPEFAPTGRYLGPLPKHCGHRHDGLISADKSGIVTTKGSVAYSSGLSKWLAVTFLSSGRDHHLKKGEKGVEIATFQVPSPVPPRPPAPPPAAPAPAVNPKILGEADFISKAVLHRGPVPLSARLLEKATLVLESFYPDDVLAPSVRAFGALVNEAGNVQCIKGAMITEGCRECISALLRQAAARLQEAVFWTTVQINTDCVTDWHTDPTVGRSLLIGLGDYAGGHLELQEHPPIDVRGSAVLFDSTAPHRTLPHEGRRITILAFTHVGVDTNDDSLCAQLRALGCNPSGADAATSSEDEDGHRRVKLAQALEGRPPPLTTRWGGKRKPYHDGAGLCSPMRWPPEDRPRVLAKTLPGLQQAFMDIVSELPHHDRGVYLIATGNATSSPFTPQQVNRARDALAAALELPPEEAAFVAPNQPFHLRLLSATLFKIGDPDWRQAVESSWSFERGVPIGVGIKMPRVPAVYERKLTWRSLDDTAFEPDRDNYKSAQAVIDTLEAQFEEDAKLGMMYQATEEELKQQYPGSRLRVAALGALEKGPNSFRVVHDGTHGVRVNNEVHPRDQVRMPGPGEARTLLERASRALGVHFALCLDVSKAHRRFLNRQADWGLQTCRIRKPMLWVNRVGTFGVGSACYWWSRLAGMLARVAGAFFSSSAFWQLIFSDDLKWLAYGRDKFRDILLAILVWELFGTPIAWKKGKGGISTDWLGYWLDYGKFELGISEQRAEWLRKWLAKLLEVGASLVRELREGLGRLGFAAGVLEWHRPFLAPLYAWTAAAPAGAFLPHPPAVHLAIRHLHRRLVEGARAVNCAARTSDLSCAYFADAKAEDGKVVLGGWEARGNRPTTECRWFSIVVTPEVAPWFFPDGRPSRTIAALELLATTLCVILFAPERSPVSSTSMHVTSAFTDNKGNTYAAAKLHTTKFPLSCVVMELATQMEQHGLWVDLHWTPRELNTLADQLTNDDFSAFRIVHRISKTLQDVQFAVLPELLKAGYSLHLQLQALRAARVCKKDKGGGNQQGGRPVRRKRSEALRVKDPW